MRTGLTLLTLFLTGVLYAQTPGAVLDPASPVMNPMNPNGDGFITSTNVAFTGPLDESQFELPFRPILHFQAEPGIDNQYDPGCEFYELVHDQANGAESAYLYYKDADSIPDNGDELLFFRFRLARFSNGATAFSVLMDTDYRFGFSGPEQDPNSLPGNPGFEKEIAVYNSTGGAGGVRVFNVDGKDTATVVNFYAPITSHYQVSYALNQDPGCTTVPVFVDMYIPFSALGISSTTQIRLAVAANEDINSSLGGGASDIGGIDGNAIPNDDDQFIAVINNFSPIAIGNSTNQAPLPINATLSVNENVANGSSVHVVSASDANGDLLTYSITSGNIGAAFVIDPGTGEITVNNSAALDAETTLTFTLLVRVSDGLLYDNAIITVNLGDVNEGPPSISDATLSLNENTVNGSPVHSTAGTDPDVMAVLSYSIIAGNTASAFVINSASGQITVNDVSKLDFETTPSFSLTVRVSDGDFFDDAAININVTNLNESPIAANAIVSLDENSEVGTVVHTVSGADPDAGTNLIYTISGGNTGLAFKIDGSSGVITVDNPLALNFEAKPSFTLTVRVSDGTLFMDATITVNLNDLNESPSAVDATLFLDENPASNFTVHIVDATDPDAGTVLSYSIVMGNTGGAFVINSSGRITVSDPTQVNFEVTPAFTLTVRVSDGLLVDEAEVKIILNDINERPLIQQGSVSLDENTPVGFLVYAVAASDPDANAELNYTITSGNTGSAFGIDNITGEIRVSNSSALDFEANPLFALGVRVSDGHLFSDAITEIRLNNVNEPPQIEDASLTFERWLDDGQVIFKVIASDPDVDDVLSFAIESGNDEELFALDSQSGEMKVVDVEPLESGMRSFDFGISATDQGGLTARGRIQITIIRIPGRSDIQPQKGFSPNDNGINDFWLIRGIEFFPENSIKVYNRWGVTVFEANGYNNEQIAWRGEVKGSGSEIESTYFYIIKAGNFEPITGYIIVKP